MISIRRKLKEFVFRIFGRFQNSYQEFTAEQWLHRTLKRGTGVRLRMPLQIYHPENLKLGSQIDIGEFSHIRASGGVSIGDRVLIASHVIISSVGHPLLPPRFGVNTSGPIIIEDDVWIGAGAIILQGVRVGAGSVIAAGAVVVDDIPPKSVAAGIPARVLRATEGRV